MKPIAVFSGDTFRNLIKQYSNQRLSRDPKYRKEVFQKLEDRRASKKVVSNEESP